MIDARASENIVPGSRPLIMKMTSASRFARGARLVVLYRIHGGRVSPGHRVPKTPYFIGRAKPGHCIQKKKKNPGRRQALRVQTSLGTTT